MNQLFLSVGGSTVRSSFPSFISRASKRGWVPLAWISAHRLYVETLLEPGEDHAKNSVSHSLEKTYLILLCSRCHRVHHKVYEPCIENLRVLIMLRTFSFLIFSKFKLILPQLTSMCFIYRVIYSQVLRNWSFLLPRFTHFSDKSFQWYTHTIFINEIVQFNSGWRRWVRLWLFSVLSLDLLKLIQS